MQTPTAAQTRAAEHQPPAAPAAPTRIAFLTSGGDAPGMNAAIRAIVRTALHRGCEPFAVMEGLRGLVEGGEMIMPYGWNDVGQIIGEGGTVIKSSRCPEFTERRHRKTAAHNLLRLGIDRLVVIGGDGSLTGADVFRHEWPLLLAELVDEGAITAETAQRHAHMMIVGLAGSIDNDMVGTEITIGANSSLHRIIEAVDCIHSTARSHQRAFVVEVMGRHCGWLALNAAISCGADWLLIPEDPPTEGWEEKMCASVAQHRAMGRTVSIVMVSEGAVDRRNQPIRSEHVQRVLQQSGLDARVTTLGHIQRGGNPSAFDRYLATVQGIRAVEAVLNADPSRTPSLLVGMNENKVTCRPLVECVAKTRAVAHAMAELRFPDALALRDPDFRTNYAMWQLMHHGADGKLSTDPHRRRIRVGVMNCGAPCGGMNAAVAASCLYAIFKGFTVTGIFNGFDGLLQDDVRELTRREVMGMVGKGGSFLGTNRVLPSTNMDLVVERIAQLSLDGLLIVGGFEAYTALLQLTQARERFPQLRRLPVVVLPATISNNVPGTEYSIGSDTALNVILQSCDYIRQSASASRKRVFVVDVHGGNCGYLAVMTALAAGAMRAYIPEEGVTLADLQRDAQHLRERFTDDRRQGRLIIRNESCSPTFSAELVSKILEEEGGGAYDSRWVLLGHLQQGGPPSPLDRIRAVKLAVLSMSHIEALIAPHGEDAGGLLAELSVGVDPPDHPAGADAVVVGIRGPRVRFTSAAELAPETDMRLRRPRDQWWAATLQSYSRILAKHNTGPDP